MGELFTVFFARLILSSTPFALYTFFYVSFLCELVPATAAGFIIIGLIPKVELYMIKMLFITSRAFSGLIHSHYNVMLD